MLAKHRACHELLLHSLVLVHRKLPHIVHRDSLQRPLIRRLQYNLWHLLIIITRPRVESLLPPIHAKTPLTPSRQARLSQIISASSTEVQKLLGHDTRNGMVACVGLGSFAVASAHEARQRLGGVQSQGLLEYCALCQHCLVQYIFPNVMYLLRSSV